MEKLSLKSCQRLKYQERYRSCSQNQFTAKNLITRVRNAVCKKLQYKTILLWIRVSAEVTLNVKIRNALLFQSYACLVFLNGECSETTTAHLQLECPSGSQCHLINRTSKRRSRVTPNGVRG